MALGRAWLAWQCIYLAVLGRCGNGVCQCFGEYVLVMKNNTRLRVRFLGIHGYVTDLKFLYLQVYSSKDSRKTASPKGAVGVSVRAVQMEARAASIAATAQAQSNSMDRGNCLHLSHQQSSGE